MRAFFCAGLLLLAAGCDSGSHTSTRDMADVADANSRTALNRINDLEAKISDLESENDTLKRRVDELQTASEQQDKWSGVIASKHNELNASFWRYQKENEERFGRLGQQWTAL